ncbi:MAG: glycine cleavage system protein GcvH [Candidatus Hodarchaeota archaeon]
MDVPNTLKYAESHEWLRVEGDDLCVSGITDYAQHELTDIVYVDYQVEADDEVEIGGVVAIIESVKTAAEVYAPISGTVIEVNEGLEESPEKVNQEPYEAWFLKIKPSKKEEIDNLLTANAYQKQISQ